MPDSSPTSDARSALAVARERMYSEHLAGTPAGSVLASFAEAADSVCAGLFERALGAGSGAGSGLALVALGGYGRRELAPHSDLDLLLLVRGQDSREVERLTRELMYPLWDAGVDVGHRVRNPREVVGMLSRVDEATAVLDARLVAGDHGLFLDLEAMVSRAVAGSRARLIRGLRDETADRHRRAGHAGHLLEPDIRDAAGGLRDVHVLGWLGHLHPAASGDDPEILLAAERNRVEAAAEFLRGVRIQMHRTAGRKVDVLYLAEQDAVAAQLRYTDSRGMAAGDAFMRDLYGHARAVDSVVTVVWERMAERPTGRRRRVRRRADRPLGDGCVVRAGRVEVVAAPAPTDDPSGWMRAFQHALTHDVAVAPASVQRLSELLEPVHDVPWNAGTLDAFLGILLGGRRALGVLEQMSEAGFLEALIPEFGRVRCLPQRNLYHRYTVDVHLFATVAEIAESRDVDDVEVAHAWARVGDPTSLLVAGLLHDIGKGTGGDHVVAGAEIAASVGERMGLRDERLEDVVFGVREHLTLAETALRRDIDDAEVVEEVAGIAGDRRRLSMLYLLTRADSIATGPEAWSTFRASLVRELYARALAALGDDRPLSVGEPAGPSWASALWASPPSAGEVRSAVRAGEGAEELVVVARDRPGLLAAVTGVLALRGGHVLSADVRTLDDGTAVESYLIRGAHGPLSTERWDRIRADIVAVLEGELDIEAALRDKSRHMRRPATVRRGVRVVVANDVSSTHTVVEVHASDRLGLLHSLARAITESGCDVSLARVATYGTDVVDVFYVTAGGGRVTDDAAMAALEQEVAAAAGSLG